MFGRSETKDDTLEQDLKVSQTIASIYSIVLQWWKIEQENSTKGTDIERRWIESVMNFDFGYFRISNQQEIEATLVELFEASEVNFVPNRIKLLASQIELRFGTGIVNYFKERLKNILIQIYKVEERSVDDILDRYPYLWIIHVAQGAALNIL